MFLDICKKSRSAVAALLDVVFPPRCAVCNALLSPERSVLQQAALPPTAAAFCQNCDPLENAAPRLFDFSQQNPAAGLCLSCGDRPLLNYPSQRCTLCEFAPLPFGRLISIWFYSGHIIPAIKAYKYSQALALQGYFGLILKLAYESTFLGKASHDLIVPIPSSLDIMRHRGYHHTRLLGLRIARSYSLPISPYVLEPARRRKPQARLAPAERLKNMQGAFRLGRTKVHGKHILLIDDILTTGTTLLEAAKVLREAGASVDALTIARSPHFMRNRLGLWQANENDVRLRPVIDCPLGMEISARISQ